MNDAAMTVEPDELHAFVDGQLDPARAAAVLAWLQAHPDDAQRVADWQAQRLALRRLHRGQDLGATPAALLRTVHARRRRWPLAAAAAALLCVGAASGWLAARLPAGGPAAVERAFARDAAIAHAVYTPEKRHAVEVAASDEAHLVQWLGRRLGLALKAPVLQDQGFRLLGGRLLPGAGGPAAPRAQFMYEDAAGRRLTLYLIAFAPGEVPQETAFRTVRSGAVESFYWVEGRFGYALSGELPSADLQALARSAYEQLSR
jgi:anti-sigma factor RsiW